MNDDEILDVLGAVLAPIRAEPPPEGIVALHRAIDAQAWSGQTGHARPLRQRRWLVATVALTGALGVSSAAFAATGAPLPRPVRQVVHTIGLPVDSPQLADARGTQRLLRTSLARRDLAAIRIHANELRSELRNLDSDERRQVEPTADSLLQQAEEDLGAELSQGNGDQTRAGHTSTVPATRATPGSDQGQSNNHGAGSSTTSAPNTGQDDSGGHQAPTSPTTG